MGRTPLSEELVPGQSAAGEKGVRPIYLTNLFGLDRTALRARFAEMGAQPAPTLGAEFNGFIKAEIERWTKVVREQNIQPE